MAQQLAVTEAVGAVARERDELGSSLKQLALEKQLAEKSLVDKYETQLRDREDTIERLRDLKSRLSTKMLGETLEQHCEVEFNRIRAIAFPRAYFEKDNDAKSGSKGDFIFRDRDEAGTEIVSIMFEMKNEADATATKKKNEDFLKELDRAARRRAANTPCWCRCWRATTSCTTAASSMSRTATPRCTWCARSSSSPHHLATQRRHERAAVQERAGPSEGAEHRHHAV